MKHPPLSISLTVKTGNPALKFYADAFGTKETFKMEGPNGEVFHAEFELNGCHVFLSEESEEWHAHAMPEGATASCLFSITTDDCDAAFKKACAAGAHPLSQPANQFWGSRSAVVRDPFGYRWGLIQQIEDVSPEEVQRRAAELFGGHG